MSENGLISAYPAAATLSRLQTAPQAAGLAVFPTFDHADAARKAGLAVRPTTVVAFGNPAAGTKLMQSNQMAGIDLPLKILVWETESGTAKLTHNDPGWLATRHTLRAETEQVIAGENLLALLTQKAAKG